ncbi:ArsR/SmtB family transcription factor [Phytohabitans aurantiacus]|nr:metalloregulator ArsR/SmtB family transcription factor [Phytohabitans aurantiacus]
MTSGQQRMTITDPQVMRALAHPARLAIMEYLSSTGAAVTATEGAEVVGLSPSATSYHLRALAKAGMVEQAPSRGDGRERVWQSAVVSWQIDAGPGADEETRAAEGALIDAYLARTVERVREWMRSPDVYSREWYDAATLNESVLFVTAEELTALGAAVRELVEPYKRRHRMTGAPAGARTVAAQFIAIPTD